MIGEFLREPREMSILISSHELDEVERLARMSPSSTRGGCYSRHAPRAARARTRSILENGSPTAEHSVTALDADGRGSLRTISYRGQCGARGR